VKTAYNMLVPLANITTLPGEFSTAALIEDTGFFVCNVVQADIALGVVGQGATITSVTDTINAIKKAKPGFSSTNFTLVEDPNIAGGVQILFTGNADHASQANLGAMTLSIATFQALNATNGNFQFYLPDNTTVAELDFTVDARTRWSTDTKTVVDFVLDLIPIKNFSLDIMYPAYEPDPQLGSLFIDTIGLPASWVQKAQVLAKNGNHTLQSVKKAVLHANFNVCEQPVAQCPFNHDPPFALIAGTDHAYDQTEKTARAIARIAVQLLNDPSIMSDVTSNIRSGPTPDRR
jgi:hypothetical protein